MGWLMLGWIGAVAVTLLWLLGLPRSLWSFAGATLMLGAAGYALQARPELPGAPVAPAKMAQADDPGQRKVRELRGEMFGRFTAIDSYFFASDALERGGDPDKAATMMLGGVRASPQDASLWTWLGMTLVEADGGTMSPAAGLSFRRGVALAPKHPGPAFFYGLALARAGQLEPALAWLRKARELTPAKAAYRDDVDEAVRSVAAYSAMQAQAGPAPAR